MWTKPNETKIQQSGHSMHNLLRYAESASSRTCTPEEKRTIFRGVSSPEPKSSSDPVTTAGLIERDDSEPFLLGSSRAMLSCNLAGMNATDTLRPERGVEGALDVSVDSDKSEPVGVRGAPRVMVGVPGFLSEDRRGEGRDTGVTAEVENRLTWSLGLGRANGLGDAQLLPG